MSATAQNDRVNNITLQDYNASVVDTVNASSEIMKRVVSVATLAQSSPITLALARVLRVLKPLTLQLTTTPSK